MSNKIPYNLQILTYQANNDQSTLRHSVKSKAAKCNYHFKRLRRARNLEQLRKISTLVLSRCPIVVCNGIRRFCVKAFLQMVVMQTTVVLANSDCQKSISRATV